MKTLAIAVILLASQAAFADTLILKDGKKLEWSALTDKGDVLEVELKTGAKVTVKKDEIERVVFGKLPDVLTGASLVWGRKQRLQVVDVLPKVDPVKVLQGTASKSSKGLSISAGPAAHAKLPCGFSPPAEYDLSVTVERNGPVGMFVIGFVVDGKQTTVHVDAYKNSVSGIMSYNGEDVMNTPQAFRGEVFGKQPVTITCMIRSSGLVVRIGDKDIVAIAVENFSGIKLHTLLEVPDKSTLFVGALEGEFLISRMTVTSKK